MLERIVVNTKAIEDFIESQFKDADASRLERLKREGLNEFDCPELFRLYWYNSVMDCKEFFGTAEEFEKELPKQARSAFGETPIAQVWDAIERIFPKRDYDKALSDYKQEVKRRIVAATTVKKVGKRVPACADQSRDFKEVGRIRLLYGLEAGAYVGTRLARGQYQRVGDAHAVINRLYGQFTPYLTTTYAEVSKGAGGYLDKTAIEMLQRRIKGGSKAKMIAVPIKVLAVEGLKVSTKQFGVIETYLPVPADLRKGYIVTTTQGHYVLAF